MNMRTYIGPLALLACQIFIFSCTLLLMAKADLYELGRGVGITETDQALKEMGLLDRLINPDKINLEAPANNRVNTPSAAFFRDALNSLVRPEFPVRTSLRYSDTSTTREVGVYLKVPLCIVGTNEGSLRWMEQNKDLLTQHEAVCAIADADNESALLTMQKLAAPVPVVVIPLEEIAARHGIDQYPVLVTGSIQNLRQN